MRHRRTWRRFARDEGGSVTLWSIVWLTGFFIIYGVAVDTTSVMHMQARLQTTADAAALGGIMGLRPTESTVDTDAGLARARQYAALNLDPATNGEYLRDEDIEFGVWDFENGTGFAKDATPHNAIRLTTRRESVSGNPLATMFLQIIDFFSWNINAVAIAAVEYEQCDLDGLISDDKVIMSSDNRYEDRFCVYGRQGVQLTNGNDFTGDVTHAYVGYGRGVTHECGFFLMGTQGAPPRCNMSSNPGLEEGWFVSDAIFPARIFETNADGTLKRDINGNPILKLDDTIADYVALAQAGTWLQPADWRASGKGAGNQPIADVVTDLQNGGTFYFECGKDSDVLEIPNGEYFDLTVVTNCLLELSGSSTTNPNIYENATFVSTSTASHKAGAPYQGLDHNIVVRGGNVLGTNCDGYGTRFLTMSGIKFDGGVSHKGNEVTAGGQVAIDGDNDAASTDVHAISVHSLGSIVMTSNSQYSYCKPGGLTADAAPVFQLVQ